MIEVVSLFSGIGAFEKGLDNLEVEYNLVGYSEIDKFASKSYSLIHKVSEEMNLGDITKIDQNKIKKNIDLVTYGFPCQDISNAGNMKGLFNEDGSKTRSGLFFDALRIIKETQPKVAIAENVKNLTSKMFTEEFEIVLDSLDAAGYNNYWKILNSENFGIPQGRERVFIVSIRKDIDNGIFNFPKKYKLEKRLKDFIEDEVDENLFIPIPHPNYPDFLKLNGNTLEVREATKKGFGVANYFDCVNMAIPNSKTRRGRIGKGISKTLTTSSQIAIFLPGNLLRYLSPKESFKLMGFDDSDYEILKSNNISNNQLYKQAGNSIVVDVAEELLCQIIDEYGEINT